MLFRSGVHEVGIVERQRRDLGAVLPGEQLGELHLLGLPGFRHHYLHRQLEVAPAVLAERVVLVDSGVRSEEHTSELQSLMRISYAVFCLRKKTAQINSNIEFNTT